MSDFIQIEIEVPQITEDGDGIKIILFPGEFAIHTANDEFGKVYTWQKIIKRLYDGTFTAEIVQNSQPLSRWEAMTGELDPAPKKRRRWWSR